MGIQCAPHMVVKIPSALPPYMVKLFNLLPISLFIGLGVQMLEAKYQRPFLILIEVLTINGECMKQYVLLFTFLCTTSCLEQQREASTDSKVCKGEWTERDSDGLVRKRFIEYYHSGMKACVTENKDLTQWEKSLIDRFEDSVTCEPQTDLLSMWLRSSNQYYAYRNDKIFVELDASKGEARRLIIGELEDGSLSYNRQVFCYYLRTDIEAEPVNPTDYGAMLLFDVELASTSSIFHPMEIYNYTDVGNDLLLTKMDDNSGVDWTWCPINTPWGVCDYLKNGNEAFYPPAPDVATQEQLSAAAILIRSEMNFIKITENEFNNMWDATTSSNTEVGTWGYVQAGGKWKYLVNSIFDEPLYIGRSWREYIRGERPFMPDVASASNNQLPLVCYSAEKEIVLGDGSTAFIDGEVCYDSDGNYSFTQN